MRVLRSEQTHCKGQPSFGVEEAVRGLDQPPTPTPRFLSKPSIATKLRFVPDYIEMLRCCVGCCQPWSVKLPLYSCVLPWAIWVAMVIVTGFHSSRLRCYKGRSHISQDTELC